MNKLNKAKRRKKRVLRMAVTLLLIGAACYLAVVGWVVYAEYNLPPRRPTEAIIVLGAQVKDDGTLSIALTRRLSVALAEYQEDPRLIIACGAQGHDEPVAEGDAMRDWLIAQGVPAGHVLAETASFNTRENLLHAKAMMEERGLSGALVVTSDYHVARALTLCERLGIEASGAGSESKPEYWIINHAREAVSWIKFWAEELL